MMDLVVSERPMTHKKCPKIKSKKKFVQNGSRCQTAAKSLQWLQDLQYIFWGNKEWPPNSLDLKIQSKICGLYWRKLDLVGKDSASENSSIGKATEEILEKHQPWDHGRCTLTKVFFKGRLPKGQYPKWQLPKYAISQEATSQRLC